MLNPDTLGGFLPGISRSPAPVLLHGLNPSISGSSVYLNEIVLSETMGQPVVMFRGSDLARRKSPGFLGIFPVLFLQLNKLYNNNKKIKQLNTIASSSLCHSILQESQPLDCPLFLLPGSHQMNRRVRQVLPVL